MTGPSDPIVVDKATVPPLPVRLLPTASFSRTVIVDVDEPFAVSDVGFAVIVEFAVDALPGVTANVDVSLLRPFFEAVTVTEPAPWPVAVKDAEPEEAVASPSPASEPAPAVCANDTTVELSAVTTLLFASSTAAVSVFVEPDATLVVFDVKTSFVAVPGVTEIVELSVVRPPPCFAAWIVTEPAV